MLSLLADLGLEAKDNILRLRCLGSGTGMGKSSKDVLEEKKRTLIDQLRNGKNKKKRKRVSSPTKAQAEPESP